MKLDTLKYFVKNGVYKLNNSTYTVEINPNEIKEIKSAS